MISIDANVLIYAVDIDAGERHVRAKEIMDTANHKNAVLTEQAIFEFFHASTRKGKTSIGEATGIAYDLAANFRVLPPQPTIIEDALALQARYRLSIWDARLLAVCNAHGCTHLLSEDLQDGARYSGVSIVNPFNPDNDAAIESLLS
ncbi:MAG TPA: PIN domain-containing protein [Rhizomicrobium sp.]|nr:PIN domain-containing protein [Rhizomicrobium sp.]